MSDPDAITVEPPAATASYRHKASTLSTSAYKDNKILYSNKTKPKRTKSQEHLPTHKKSKKQSRESPPGISCLVI